MSEIDKLLDWPHTSDDQVLLSSALCVITAGDVRALRDERNAFHAALLALDEFWAREWEGPDEAAALTLETRRIWRAVRAALAKAAPSSRRKPATPVFQAAKGLSRDHQVF